MPHRCPDNTEKQNIWNAYSDRRPVRVPVRLNTNPRIVLMDPKLNPHGYTFEQAANDPQVHVQIALQHQLHLRTTLNRFTDSPTGLPEVWEIGLSTYNVYEAALLGGPVRFLAGQVPSNEPALDDANKHAVFDIDVSRPLEMPFIRDRLSFWGDMERVCSELRFEGRPVKLLPWALCGTDGQVTAGCSLRGDAFLLDLVEDPLYAQRLLAHLTTLAVNRRQAFWDYWGDRLPRGNWMADDSCALLSLAMYRQQVLPHHQRFLNSGPAGSRGFHLCGNAQRLFPTLRDELAVTSIDTGFPIDHGRLRQELGTDVEISGGPEIALLLGGTPDQVYRRTSEILQSGVTEGGRFILQEGNNLPPQCPLANLEAMYQACLEYGWFQHEAMT